MARQSPTRLQLSGYRFLLRRTAHALVRGDARMLDDPLRAQSVSFLVGCSLVIVAVVVGGILAVLRPGSTLGDAQILMSPASGALYVHIDGTVHPVPNLSSARLVTGAAADPVPVSEAALASARRGPLIGIPGAPPRIDPPLAIDESGWTICDRTDPAETVLIIGWPGDEVRPFGSGSARLVVPRGEGPASTYLLFDGRRAAIDLRDIAVLRALRLEGVAPLPVSRALLDSVPEVPGVRAPLIPDAGRPGPPDLGGMTVGTVVRLARADTAEFYVVRADGLQRVGRVAADLVRFTVPQPRAAAPDITADVVASMPVVADLDVGALPDHVQTTTAGLCVGWDPRRSDLATKVTLYTGDSVDRGAIGLAQRDGEGPNLDAVTIAPGRSALVRSKGLLEVDGETSGTLYLIDDRGVRYGIRDDDTATCLGLAQSAVPAPWPMLSLLPYGPELSRAAASTTRDGLTPAT